MKNLFLLVAFALAASLSAQEMHWVPSGEVNQEGFVDGTDCATNTICYALAYTATQGGTLTSYTAGFEVECDNNPNFIVSNESTVMVDKSSQIMACEELGKVALNCFGNSGSVQVKADRTVYLHQICLQTSKGSAGIQFTASKALGITTSLDIPAGEARTEEPVFLNAKLNRSHQLCDPSPEVGGNGLFGQVDLTEADEMQIDVFPNPVVNNLRVRVTTAAELINLNILDANGRILASDKRQTKTFHDVDVSEFPAGTYYISVVEEQAELTKKFVIVR